MYIILLEILNVRLKVRYNVGKRGENYGDN